MHKITMLGGGLIGMFYTRSLHANRSRDRVHVLYSRSAERAKGAAAAWGVEKWTIDMSAAIHDPDTDVVVVGLPNALHREAVLMAAKAGKAVLCTKPLGRTAAEGWEILEAVEKAGVFHGYLEDLVFNPKVLKAIESIQKGAVGRVLWTRSREAHPGPHSAWFWDRAQSGGGAIIDMGCHCIELGRSFIGKAARPVEVMCWAETQVHPIDVEDSAIGLVRYDTGAIGQFEVSWCFRGGMDLRDEVAGTEGTVWINHWLRTGFEMFTSVGSQGYVAEKAEGDTGWLFPVGDETAELGYDQMFARTLDAFDAGTEPMETFYDGYVVNEIMDACYRSVRSRAWEPVTLRAWRGPPVAAKAPRGTDFDKDYQLVKREVMPDGKAKLILKEKASDRIVEKII
jgi:predicted dehydrogenase